MENDFLAIKKNYPWLETHFLSISQANIYFFSIGKKTCSDKKYFVKADARGISDEILN